jgi:hypothetical protein
MISGKPHDQPSTNEKPKADKLTALSREQAGKSQVHAFVLVRDVEGAAFGGDGYAFDAREAGELADEICYEMAGARIGGRMQRKWVATVSLPPG